MNLHFGGILSPYSEMSVLLPDRATALIIITKIVAHTVQVDSDPEVSLPPSNGTRLQGPGTRIKVGGHLMLEISKVSSLVHDHVERFRPDRAEYCYFGSPNHEHKNFATFSRKFLPSPPMTQLPAPTVLDTASQDILRCSTHDFVRSLSAPRP